jgi:hypothetical protein
MLGIRNEFIDGLATQQLACQGQLLALEILPPKGISKGIERYRFAPLYMTEAC